MKARLDRFVADPATHVLVHPRHEGFDYSDGEEAERRIMRVLEQAGDRGLASVELQRAIVDWPTEYHLSRQRHNLLRHLPLERSAQVLELGAGCGAITRQLGESGAAVTAIEGSLARARCAAARCVDLPNVTVYCSDFHRVEFAQTYDFVFMIGVLEYSPMFFDDERPFGACLEMVRQLLKPGGRLVLAMENRLGLKYFMGCSEDHTGRPYVGIQDLYAARTARTLGREELRAVLQAAGFAHVEFQYPFPDYKIPKAVFTERAFLVAGFAPGEIIRQLGSRDYLQRTAPAFSEALVWPQIAANGLIPALSHSFLVIAGSGSDAGGTAADSLLAVLYCADRRPECDTQTRFLLDGSGGIAVVKDRLFDVPPRHSDVVELTLTTSAYRQGSHLGSEMMKRLLQDDPQGFLGLCNLWHEYVMRHGLQEPAGRSAAPLIKSDFIDCIPANLILNQRRDGVEYIDREWRYLKPYTLELLMIRGLYQFQTANGLDDFLLAADSAFSRLARGWLESLHVPLTAGLVRSFVEAEYALCAEIYGGGFRSPLHDVRSRIDESWARRQARSLQRLVRRSARRIAQLG